MRSLCISLLLVAACGQNGSPNVTVPIATSTAASAASGADCGAPSDYVPQPEWSARQATLPPAPALPTKPMKAGDAYTVFGAIHQLRSASHSNEVTAAPIAIVGYVVDSNIPRAPACAVHPAGKADPPGCESEMPSFWIADEKGLIGDWKIRVVGWARNFASVYDAMAAYKKLKPGTAPASPVFDDVLNVVIPYPLPAVGMKVKLTGSYGFAKAIGSGQAREPLAGVMALAKMEVLEPAPTVAAFAKP